MTSVLGRRFVPKRKIPFFNFQRLAYILTLATTFLFLSHENTAYTTVYKLVMQFAIVIFMYKGKFALRVLMGAAHFFTLFIGEFLSLNAIYALGIPIERLYVKFSFWVLICDLLSSLLVFIVGFVAHRIREFPTKSLSSKQLQKLSALPIAAGAAVIVFCMLEYSLIPPGLPVGCASLVLIASLAVGITFQLDIFSEMLKTQQHSRAAAASAQEAQFELEKVQETVRHGEDVRRLEHDMKNLLLMIHILNEQGDGESMRCSTTLSRRLRSKRTAALRNTDEQYAFRLKDFRHISVPTPVKSPRMPAITPTAPKRRKMYEPFNSAQDYRFLSFKRSCCMDG